jgi:phosphatidylinositol alpha-1,6-mannosyltransferase
VTRHILLTNDFPPKVGGIQSYLWELWRRLPPDDVTVYTSSYAGGEWWDRQQKFRVVRAREPVLLPQPHLARRVRELAARTGAEAIVIDPAQPLGLIGPSLGLPYAVVLHGAEVTVPGRLPVSRQLLARSLGHASMWIAAGTYPEVEARRALLGRGVDVGNAPGSTPAPGSTAAPDSTAAGADELPPARLPLSVRIPPGVDTERFRPLSTIERAAARRRLGLPTSGLMVASISRLVPRKGMDTLIEAAALASPRLAGHGLTVAIGGGGRDRRRLERLASHANIPVTFLGKLPEADMADFYACADVFALCCRSRWWGLEQEGFGIVLVEAAASGLPCITIDSGGAGEAVVDGETGLVVADDGPPGDDAAPGAKTSARQVQVAGVADALVSVLSDPSRARHMGEAGRRRAEEELAYDILALKLATALDQLPTLAPAGDGGGAPRSPGAVPGGTAGERIRGRRRR